MMRSPAYFSSVRQLNVHPSMMLWPRRRRVQHDRDLLVAALGSGRSSRVQTSATR